MPIPSPCSQPTFRAPAGRLSHSRIRVLSLSLAAACIATIGTVAAASDRNTPLVKAIANVKDSVVNIHGQKMLGAADEPTPHGELPRRVNGMGTGVIIDERGYIITNFHVVDGVQKIEVTLADGTNYVAQLIASDSTADLAVIKINAQNKFPVITSGTSDDILIGETVIAVGNAYGYENTVTEGIVSALHRAVQVSDAQGYEDLIQTSAQINPGNSGGPLVNIDGEMIGINVAVRAGAQGIGFAIPVDKAMNIAAKLLSVERIDKRWHGIIAQESTGAHTGLIVTSVDKESPAAQVGLKAGDVITAVGKQEVARPLDLERCFIGRKPGEEVPLTVRRNDQSVKLALTLAPLPSRTAETDLSWDILGLRLSPISAAMFKQMQSQSPRMGAYHGGVTITEVRPDSPAARQHLRSGDVLVGMHIWETVSIENVNYILTRPDLSEIDPVKFYIVRGKDTFFGHFDVAMKKGNRE
jgi:serine protease Do